MAIPEACGLWIEQTIDVANTALDECKKIAMNNNISTQRVVSALSMKILSVISNNLPKKEKKTWIYYIRSGDRIKIGVSSNPQNRLSMLATMCPYGAVLLGKHLGSREDEGTIHKMFSEYRCNGEWFRAENEILNYIEGVC